MNAKDLLRRLRVAARRRDLPTLASITDSRGPDFMWAYQALVRAGYYRRRGDSPKSRRKRIDAALSALGASDA